MKLDHCLTLYTKANSRYKDLIIKGKTLKVLGENIREFLSDLGVITNLKTQKVSYKIKY